MRTLQPHRRQGKIFLRTFESLTAQLTHLHRQAEKTGSENIVQPCQSYHLDKTDCPRTQPKPHALRQHRDDLQLLLNEKSATQFGSEGQKRTLAIALKMAQAEYLTGIHGSAPVLLIDDVMGELDAKRRSGLLPLLERARETSGQVFMTCTEANWPRELGREVQRWEVKAGALLA